MPKPRRAAGDMEDARDRILAATLRHVPFEGWTRAALAEGVKDAGLSDDMALRTFPAGIPELVEHYGEFSNRRMLAALPETKLAQLRVRDRVAVAVRTRIGQAAPHREAVRRLMAYLALPQNAPLAARLAYRMANAVWYAAGDTSVDFNFYTKRALLAGVYTSTLLYWLQDEGDGSGDFPDTWAFLDRRIGDVLKIFGWPKRVREGFASAFAGLRG
ncbi:MAG: COQ9 family protein [Rhodospirillales bacterium]|nr:COQ9 family protein [Rhodospirillales bacterium]